MHVGEILSELRTQRRRIDRAIAALEMLKPQPTRQRKQKTARPRSKSGTEGSRHVYPLATEKERLGKEEAGSPAKVIPFGRLRRRA
jgi:hypothetical protein